ncbi:MAG TPA: hypothetical protein VN611_03110 [Patescibacteria group bacterium]|nr:hypothetical protein [Patescibacteria group bacterium]
MEKVLETNRCQQCNHVITSVGAVRCPRCNYLLLRSCEGNCRRCKVSCR